VVAEPVEFEARVFGRLGPDATAAFTDLSVHVKAGMTLMSARWTQPGLHGVLERIPSRGWSSSTSAGSD
jgi:hypothetical protein